MAIALTLTNCATVSTPDLSGSTELTALTVKFNREAALDTPFQILVEEVSYSGAFSYTDDNTKIFLTRGLLNDVEAGRVSKDQLYLIIGHEIGHLERRGMPRMSSHEEELFCDSYGLLLLEEMRNDGADINLYEAISYFLTHDYPESETHPSSKTRYHELKSRLDYWAHNEGRREAA